jgi:hypothetical protein
MSFKPNAKLNEEASLISNNHKTAFNLGVPSYDVSSNGGGGGGGVGVS